MSGGFATVLLLLASQQGTPSAQPEPKVAPASAADPWYASHRDEFLGLYIHLHTHPELSYQEVKTAARLAAELKRAGAKVTTGVGKLGVVGLIENGPGPVVLVRTDMDALPVVEQTGLPYASKVKARDSQGREVGVMHACGHDVHMTCFIGTARWLTEHKNRWSGTVVMIAQPAEEAIGGLATCSPMVCTAASPSLTSPLRCTAARMSPPALSCTVEARSWPARPRSP